MGVDEEGEAEIDRRHEPHEEPDHAARENEPGLETARDRRDKAVEAERVKQEKAEALPLRDAWDPLDEHDGEKNDPVERRQSFVGDRAPLRGGRRRERHRAVWGAVHSSIRERRQPGVHSRSVRCGKLAGNLVARVALRLI